MDRFLWGALQRGDILKLELSDLTEEGIKIHISKTQNKILILWSEALRACVEPIKEFSLSRNGKHLLCTQRGRPYSSHGFDAMWKRTMQKALEQKVIEERFRFHDIRRKAATDAERHSGREYARQLLGHQEQATTAIYISGIERVKPLF